MWTVFNYFYPKVYTCNYLLFYGCGPKKYQVERHHPSSHPPFLPVSLLYFLPLLYRSVTWLCDRLATNLLSSRISVSSKQSKSNVQSGDCNDFYQAWYCTPPPFCMEMFSVSPQIKLRDPPLPGNQTKCLQYKTIWTKIGFVQKRELRMQKSSPWFSPMIQQVNRLGDTFSPHCSAIL